jgi:outer membrane protein with beta-barrel domain
VRASAFAAAMLTPAAALAVEHQQHLGVDGGVAIIAIDQKPTPSIGGGGGVHWAYGLSDSFNLMVEGAFCPVALQELPNEGTQKNNRPTMIENLGVGIGYVLDVLRWVPYVGIMASAFTLHGGTVNFLFAAGATLAVGLDYQVTRGPRHLNVGLAVRQHFILSDFVDYPSYTQIFLRAEYVWGF